MSIIQQHTTSSLSDNWPTPCPPLFTRSSNTFSVTNSPNNWKPAPLFYGTFRKGVAANSLNICFPYTFTFKLKPTSVRIHMYRDPASKTNWVFCQRA